MRIDTALCPAEIQKLSSRDLSTVTCVVFDVLRAISSMVTALAHGAESVIPVATIAEALDLNEKRPEVVLGGERYGDRIEGFQVGNSPLEYTEFSGRSIVTTTTNGTIALRSVASAGRVLVSSLLNLDATAAELRRSAPEEVLMVCAGTFETFALEDACAAGILIREMADAELTDAAACLSAVASAYPTGLEALRAARNGIELERKGRGDDVEFCAERGRFDLVAEMFGGVIRKIRSK